MSGLILFLAIALLPQSAFTDFSFCREGPREGSPVHCIELNAQGEGVFAIRSDDEDETVEEMFELSAPALAEFVRLLEDTDYLNEGSEYESGRRAANLGLKTLAVEGEWGTRRASFNYSSKSEVNRLQAFLEGLVSERLLLLDLEFALRFDRLDLPTLLDRIEADLRRDRFPDPPGLLPHLREIVSDGRVVGYARETAERLIRDIEDE